MTFEEFVSATTNFEASLEKLKQVAKVLALLAQGVDTLTKEWADQPYILVTDENGWRVEDFDTSNRSRPSGYSWSHQEINVNEYLPSVEELTSVLHEHRDAFLALTIAYVNLPDELKKHVKEPRSLKMKLKTETVLGR